MSEGVASTAEAIEKLAGDNGETKVTGEKPKRKRASRKKNGKPEVAAAAVSAAVAAVPTAEEGGEKASKASNGNGKKAPAKKKRKRRASFNVDKDIETGVMKLPENHYFRLTIAEQGVKIKERDLHIAKYNVKEYQANANAQLQALQTKVKEAYNELNARKSNYLMEVQAIEKDTKLQLKEWTVDDDRILRPIEQVTAT